MHKRFDVLILAFSAFLFITSGNSYAQSASPTTGETTPATGDQPQTTPPADQGTGEKPTAAVGEQGTKPTGAGTGKPVRGFVSALAHNLGDDVKHIPRRNSLYWWAGGAALALAVHPADHSINAHLESSGAAGTFFFPGHIIGSTYTFLAFSTATYIFGRAEHHPRAQHLGMDLLEATLLSEGLVEGMKIIVRRPRPTPLPGQTQASTYSFPSGHSALTFSVATVLQQHLGYKAAIPTYLIATYVAMSRLHDNQHYASDVVFGAATGIVVGRSVTWHGRNFYATPMLVPGGAGIALMASR